MRAAADEVKQCCHGLENAWYYLHMPVNSTHGLYDQLAESWQRVRDVLAVNRPLHRRDAETRRHKSGPNPANRSVPHPSRGWFRARRETSSPQPEGEGGDARPRTVPDGAATLPTTRDGSFGRKLEMQSAKFKMENANSGDK